MAFVYYKFKSSKNFHILPINGRFISLYDFKAEIVASDRYCNGNNNGNDNDNDFDLLISDATTDQQFTNESSLISANSSLLIRRVPRLPSAPIVGREISTVNPSNIHCKEDRINGWFKFLVPEKDFGFVRKSGIPPQGYICHRSKVAGHYIQHCPTNDYPKFDFQSVKPISELSDSSSNSSRISSISSNVSSVGQKMAPELCCPCEGVMKDAALTKCCFASFCCKCISDQIVSDSDCVCRSKIVIDDIPPNMTLRDTMDRILKTESKDAAMKRKHSLAENGTQQKKLH
ncbi:hypothetical protein V6N13_134918 [Hibiscus sabdariffa]|uniref:DWNN domain-containing protein n=1 Tax=Hibiscus sabdariffa TaxID=183260 RepID=A0ABR2R574_9ROSI